jgi:hypothetical protein
MTWDYSSPIDTVPPQSLPDEWVWERLRLRRNALLAETDFRMVSDAPWDTEVWAVYRQALRDLPDATNDPRQAVWPTPPEA